MSDELWRLGAAELAGLIRKREVTSREVVEAHLRRIEAVNGIGARDHGDARRRRAGGRRATPTPSSPPAGRCPRCTGCRSRSRRTSTSPDRRPRRAWSPSSRPCPTSTPRTSPSSVPPAPSRWPARTCPTSASAGTPTTPCAARPRTRGTRRGRRAARAAGKPQRSPRGCRRSGWATTTAGRCASRPSSAASASLRPTLGRVPYATAFTPEDFPITLQLMAVQGPMARRVADLRLALQHMCGRGPAGSVVDTRSARRSAGCRGGSPCGGAPTSPTSPPESTPRRARSPMPATTSTRSSRRMVDEAARLWANLVASDARMLVAMLRSAFGADALRFIDSFFELRPDLDKDGLRRGPHRPPGRGPGLEPVPGRASAHPGPGVDPVAVPGRA